MPVVSLVDTWIETLRGYGTHLCPTVVSLVDTWIETTCSARRLRGGVVVSLVDTWIETCKMRRQQSVIKSCPSWTRGLKHIRIKGKTNLKIVVSLVDTWIET